MNGIDSSINIPVMGVESVGIQRINPRLLQVPNEQGALGKAMEPEADKVPLPPQVAAGQRGLERFSLLGCADELAERARPATPFLGRLALVGQQSNLFAPPNAGKTLITLKLLIDAVEEGRIVGSNVYYMNADDNAAGLAEKAGILEGAGVHMIAPGYKGFTTSQITKYLEEMICDQSADGKVVIVDTLKKAVDVMDKKAAAAFGDVCRRFVTAGGTAVVLAHTNKNRSASGKNVFGGVGDLLDDPDAAYVADVTKRSDGETVVTFTRMKTRGNNPEVVSFAYSGDPALSYAQRLASVRQLSDDEIAAGERALEMEDEAEVIEAIKSAISGGSTSKKAVVAAVIKATSRSGRSIEAILDKYCGHHAESLWSLQRQAHGRHAYTVIDDDRF